MQARFKPYLRPLLATFWLALLAYGFYYVFSALYPYLNGKVAWQFPAVTPFNVFLFAIICVLMLLNWGIEVLKWKWAVSDLEPTPWGSAVRATLVGVAVSTWMPNRLGEYIGKVFFVKPQHHFGAVISALHLSYAQIIATLSFGLAGGLYFIWHFQESGQMLDPLLYGLAALGLMLTGAVMRRRIARWARRQNRYLRLFIMSFTRFSVRMSYIFIALSALRFLVFSTQFYLALWLFGIALPPLAGLSTISLIYGLLTLIPASALAGLGLRGALASYFIGFLSSNQLGIIQASYFIWLVNLLLPSICGLALLALAPAPRSAFLAVFAKSHRG
jgi:hypothetical protein